LGLIVVGAVWFNQNELQTIISAVLSVVDEVFEEVIHVWLENVPEVNWVINLSKY
jgi:hypothetical protein